MHLDEAIGLFRTALGDFSFATTGDAARAVAMILSPALKMGGWIKDDFPLDIAEADQSQAGKTFRQLLTCAIYNEIPTGITQTTGGVGSLDERISAALIAGRPIITFDNFRGRLDSPILETAIRGVGHVTARALRTCASIDVSAFLWMLSTNGAELTRDIANRSIVTRIRKQAAGFEYRVFPEGNILDHIRKHQAKFLGATHAVIREWVRQGCPRTSKGGAKCSIGSSKTSSVLHHC